MLVNILKCILNSVFKTFQSSYLQRHTKGIQVVANGVKKGEL